jgi:hypothetical protein
MANVMIWFACKQCGKIQGRPETSIGSLIFCDCGQGNTVPWESTVPEPEPPPVPAALPAKAEPITLADDKPLPVLPAQRRRRRARYRPDPNYCLNHQAAPSQQTCVECGEAFCNDCVIQLDAKTLCGPCKNFQVRTWQKPARLSGMALLSLILAIVFSLLGICLVRTGNPLVGMLALLPHAMALVLGLFALRDTERNPKISGRSLAITGIVTAAVAALLTLVLNYYTPGMFG